MCEADNVERALNFLENSIHICQIAAIVEAMKSTTPHPFGALLNQLRARQPGLTQNRLAELTGYDPAVIARMGQGLKDLTGPQARERVVRVIQTLDDTGVLNGLAEANALLTAAGLPPLFAGNYVEAALIEQLNRHHRVTADSGLAAPSLPRHNLPAQFTSFVGREQEIGQITQFLTQPIPQAARKRTPSQAKLLTLTGPGGVGKTRLAIEAALAMQDDFADGLWWVSLAALHDASLIAQSIIDVLQLNPLSQTQSPPPLPLNVLVRYLANRKLLLILDNCEHLIDPCAEIVLHLMSHCPTLRILATSREALQVPSELALRVPPLAAPHVADHFESLTDFEFDAVQLFVERAQAIQPEFVLSTANASAIAHICERLDGIPLALELAAALLQVLSVDEIAARIDNRFILLKGGYRTATLRHQALSHAVDWSYNLLTPTEQILLARVSVFAGSWDAEAAERVCADAPLQRADIVPTLRQLVNKSLVVIDERHSNATRYRLLKTIHEYAADKLNERNEGAVMNDNRLNYLIELAEAINELRTHDHEQALTKFQAQHTELREALSDAATNGHIEALLRLTTALQRIWVASRNRDEGTAWMRRAVAQPNFKTAPVRLRTALLFAWAWTYPNENEHYAAIAPMAETMLAESRAAQDPIAIAQAATVLSDIARNVTHDFVQARRYLEEALPIFEAQGDRWAIFVVRHRMGVVLGQLDRAAAEAWLQGSIALYRQWNDHRHLSTALADLAWLIADANPKDDRLVEWWRQSVEAATLAGDTGLQAEFSLQCGYAELAAGETAQAAEHFAQALTLSIYEDNDPVDQTGINPPDKVGIWWSAHALCQLDGARALAIMQPYLQGKQAKGDRYGVAAAHYFVGLVHQLSNAPDMERARQHYEQALTLLHELNIVVTRYDWGGVIRTLLALAQVNQRLGQSQRARDYAAEGLRLCQEHRQPHLEEELRRV